MEITALVSMLLLSVSHNSVAWTPVRQYMSIQQAEMRWGKSPFDVKNFKTGNESIRASMVASLIASKALIGKPFKSIREELGNPDGYFENKAIPAYLLSTKEKDIWQVIILPDDRWEKVSDVRIHKNCCE